MKKYVVLALFCCFIGGFIIFSRTEQEISAPKILRIGVECDYAPNNWEENNPSDYSVPLSNHQGYYADGYDIQIAKIVADNMKCTLEVKKLAWDHLIPALLRGEIDAIFSGMLDNKERRRMINFSDTYEVSETEYAVIVNTSTKYVMASKLTDFKGAKFTGQKSTNLYSAISQVPGAIALPAVDTVTEMLEAVTSGRADASVINLDTGRSYEVVHKNLKVIRFPKGRGFNVGFSGICAGVRKNDKELLSKINDAIEGIKKSERRSIMEKVVARLWKNL
ncbi:MAG: transporter substrate-binding domain-containing protein [Synergistaceae bacterium]|nr:transporter substrate-binding domain-containing protein [Synergistaceae bacterium]MBR0167488.1 transporter substrate-binding domain-containing protein [Synergistaceae bacterium]